MGTLVATVLACGGKAGQPDSDAMQAASTSAGGAAASTASMEIGMASVEGGMGDEAVVGGAAGSGGFESSQNGGSGSQQEELAPEQSCPPRDDLDIGTSLGAGNNVLRAMCARCHDPEAGSEREIAEPYFSGLGNAVANGLLDPCNPSDSPLVQSMSQGRMPPEGDPIGFAEVDREAIEAAIPALCEPEPLNTSFCSDAPGYPGCDVVSFESLVETECSQCHGADADAEHRAARAGIDAADLRSLIDAGLVVPCDADDSPLVQVLRAGEVAPHDRCVQFPSSRRVEQIATFIDGLCVP